MSTRSLIGIKECGRYKTIYCHFDGYLKGGVGETLYRHYSNPTKLRQLLDLGDISCLGEEIEYNEELVYSEQGTTIAYCRDRGEDLRVAKFLKPSQFKRLLKYSWAEYIYLYTREKWNVYSVTSTGRLNYFGYIYEKENGEVGIKRDHY